MAKKSKDLASITGPENPAGKIKIPLSEDMRQKIELQRMCTRYTPPTDPFGDYDGLTPGQIKQLDPWALGRTS